MMKKACYIISWIIFLVLMLNQGIFPVSSEKLNVNDLMYSTFFGGSAIDIGTAVTQDSKGNIIIAGLTYSVDFPVTSGAYDETHNGGVDVFVSKFTPDGKSLLFSTFIGGSKDELHNWSANLWSSQIALAVDSADNIIVHGPTHSLDFPVTPGVYDETYNGDPENYTGDMFVCKLAENGSDLIFSTYLGGSDAEENAQEIAIDDSDNIYLSGLTSSIDFPTTPDALNTTHNGAWDTFVTKLAANGSSLLYSTFFGGSRWELGVFIKLDSEKNMYIGGTTYSDDLPTTPNAFNPNEIDDPQDGFIAKISSDGSELLYSTYIGGSGGVNSVYDMAVDAAGTMYVAGITDSSDMEVTYNAYDMTFNGVSDGFFMKIASSGSLIYSTFLGGANRDTFFKILLDSNNDVYLFGTSQSNNYPMTLNAYDSTHNGEWDYIITKMVNNGSCLLYSTYLGGSADEPTIWQGRPYHTYPDFLLLYENSVVIGGNTASTDYPVTNNAMNKTLNGEIVACLSNLTFTDLPTYSTTEGLSTTDSTHTDTTATSTTNGMRSSFLLPLISIIGILIVVQRKRK